MRPFSTALLLVLAALAAMPAAAQVRGSYRVVQVNGRPLPTPSPTEPNVTLRRLSFVFQADGRFSMSARSGGDGDEVAFSQAVDGTFRVRGDSLLLSPESGDGRVVGFGWRMRRDTLHMIDEFGNDFALTAVPWATAERLQGSHRLTRINGEPVPAPSPAEPGVRMDVLNLVLRPDGSYTMEVRAHHLARNAPIAIDVSGTYRVDADALVLQPDRRARGVDPAEFRWRMEGDALLLTDEWDEEFTFARQ
jgi:hypothetical protein